MGITLVVTERFALVALIAAGLGRHCCPTSSDSRCRRLPRKLVDVKVHGGLLDLLQRGESVSVIHLPDEAELLRERVQQKIILGVIEYLLPHVRQAKSQVIHGGYEVSQITARRHHGGEQCLPSHTPSYLRIPIKTLLQSPPRCTATAQTAHLSTLMRPEGDVGGTLGVEIRD